METIKLVILLQDKDYAFALGEALSVFNNKFIITVLSSENPFDVSDAGSQEAVNNDFSLQEAANKDVANKEAANKFDLLILDFAFANSLEKFAKDKRTIRLSESRADCVKDLESMTFVLYKFVSVQDLATELLLYYSLLTGKGNFTQLNENMRIISFCSAKGGVGKTTIALGVGQALRRYYAKSVLYLSLEEIESTLLYMKKREDGLDLSAYLYYLFKPGGNKPDAEAFMIGDKFGIKAFVPSMGKNELRELTAEQKTAFLQELATSGTYDYILVDMGESLFEEARRILNISNRIIVVSEFSTIENVREKRYIEYLQYETNENLITVFNKVTEPEEIAFDSQNIYIEFDPESIKTAGEIIEISIDQDFGVGIKELVKRII